MKRLLLYIIHHFSFDLLITLLTEFIFPWKSRQIKHEVVFNAELILEIWFTKV